MELFTAIETRRSIKHYLPNAPVREQDFEKIMAATRLSPTSYNIQHWRFVRVRDTDLRQQIEDAAWGQKQVTQAAELLLLCADINAWQDRPERYWEHAPSATRDLLIPMLTEFYAGKPELQRDEAIRSCGIAAQTLMLAARGLGYDSCPMIGFDHEQVARLINLPDNHLIAMMLTLGKAAESAHPRGGQLPLQQVLVENSF